MPALYITLGILGGLFCLLAVFYFVTVTPRLSKRKEIKRFAAYKYAHRGLHSDAVAENSITAFRLAAEAGYAIELDVRLSADGVPVVFHDSTVDRVTSYTGKVASYRADELGKMSLLGTEDTVPLFEDVLKTVGGRVPILVELKEEPGGRGVAEKTLDILSSYGGEYIIESFNPKTLGEVRKINPNVLTGILCTNYLKEKKYRNLLYFAVQSFFTNILCRPDFVSYDAKEYKKVSFRLFRRLFGVCSFAWTVCSEQEEKEAYSHKFDTVIFEGYKSEIRNGNENEI